MPFKAPFAAQLAHQHVACAAGLAVRAVVSAHHGLDLCLPYQRPEGGEVGLFQILPGGDGIEVVAQRLRPAVYREMLGAGRCAQGFAVPLQAADKGFAEPRGQIGVLAVGLMPAPPAGITENVDIRGPHGEPVIDIPVAFGGVRVVFRTGLGGDGRGDFFQQLIVEHGRKPDGLGKARGGAAAGQAVQRLVPPVIGGDAQPLDRGRVKTQLRCALLNCHARDQCLGAFSCFFPIHFGTPLHRNCPVTALT